jgi:presenilin-like A22 family membrane protease|tara:strand:+ start:1524 stop:2459 length:936 start_codon:yes stop_codon:yes gene_type:complete
MKHSLRVTIWLLVFFFISQIVGLLIVSSYVSVEEVEVIDPVTNEILLVNGTVAQALPHQMERPEFESSSGFIIYLVMAILIATIMFLFLVKLKTVLLWKAWFFFAVFLCLTVGFAAFINQLLATILGLLFAAWKVFKPNILVHNFTEMFVYGGLAAILVPIKSVTPYTIIVLLLIVSVYDAYSVWKSKHMIKMAKFQANSKVFAGLLVPYKEKKSSKKKAKGKVHFKGVQTAILGGGDVAFPLLFSGAILKSLLMTGPFGIVFLKTMIIPVFVSIALAFLFLRGREDRFYPALPFLTAGCLVGYGVLLLVI